MGAGPGCRRRTCSGRSAAAGTRTSGTETAEAASRAWYGGPDSGGPRRGCERLRVRADRRVPERRSSCCAAVAGAGVRRARSRCRYAVAAGHHASIGASGARTWTSRTCVDDRALAEDRSASADSAAPPRRLRTAATGRSSRRRVTSAAPYPVGSAEPQIGAQHCQRAARGVIATIASAPAAAGPRRSWAKRGPGVPR